MDLLVVHGPPGYSFSTLHVGVLKEKAARGVAIHGGLDWLPVARRHQSTLARAGQPKTMPNG